MVRRRELELCSVYYPCPPEVCQLKSILEMINQASSSEKFFEYSGSQKFFEDTKKGSDKKK